MKNIQLYLILLVSILFVMSCKQDSNVFEDSKIDVSKVDNSTAEIQVDASLIEKRKAKRLSDSLNLVADLSSGGEKVNGDKISRMLDGAKGKSESFIADGIDIPNACDFVSESQIAALFNVPVAEINEASGKRRNIGNDFSKSCFWRWGDVGILVQISTNPLRDEVNDWSTRYMNTKKSFGEKSLDDPTSRFVFKDFDGPGIYNIYNEELGRYYMAKDENYITSIIFNGNFKSLKRMKIVKQIMTEIHSKL